MKTQWIFSALLCGALTAACGDGRPADRQEAPENQVAAPAEGTGGEVSAPESATVEPPPPASSEDTRGQRTAPRQTPRPPAASRTPDGVPAPSSESTSRNSARSEPTAPPAPRWQELTLPAGTALPLELTTPVSTRTATVETPVSARLRNGVIIDGRTVLPAGTVFSGQVIDVERPGRVEGRARLALRFTDATVNGSREVIRTNPITFEGEATKGEDATKIGAGAGIGAVIGGIVGGGDGAAKGAAIGGAAGTGAVLATRGREVELASGTDLAATTASPVTLQVER